VTEPEPPPGPVERKVVRAVNAAVLKAGAITGPYANVCAERAGASVTKAFAAMRRLRPAARRPRE
jgi:hypothetical protein